MSELLLSNHSIKIITLAFKQIHLINKTPNWIILKVLIAPYRQLTSGHQQLNCNQPIKFFQFLLCRLIKRYMQSIGEMSTQSDVESPIVTEKSGPILFGTTFCGNNSWPRKENKI